MLLKWLLVLHKCVVILRPVLFPFKEGKIDIVDFTEWMFNLLSSLTEEISPNPEALSWSPKKYARFERGKGVP